MTHLLRFGVSMDAELLAAFDQLISRKGYANRSEALRDLVRDAIVETQWANADEPTVAALCMVYDHHQAELSAKLTALQHDFTEHIISTLHVHLDHRHCLEVVVLRGPAGELKQFSDRMLATRGVKHGQLVMTGTGQR
ncbi:MAG TPA: nickel-responsive transcriptional regulator NikR [Phycisphaerae bacterium]|nr:nickel-responsive transcriptional regulator NikR [Phycisphaerales bacterium]HRX83893.1 nickel-responsive transcriptional regulator NikR [Phycisphaerae bacterium]